jgi:hypothetical protein
MALEVISAVAAQPYSLLAIDKLSHNIIASNNCTAAPWAFN